MLARFESRCQFCQGTIREGDEIELLQDEQEYVHKECAREEADTVNLEDDYDYA